MSQSHVVKHIENLDELLPQVTCSCGHITSPTDSLPEAINKHVVHVLSALRIVEALKSIRDKVFNHVFDQQGDPRPDQPKQPNPLDLKEQRFIYMVANSALQELGITS